MSRNGSVHSDGGIERPASVLSSRRVRTPYRNGKGLGIVGNATWFSSITGLLNTIVGAGVLAMPFAFSHMGIVLGIVVILWAGLTAGFGLYLQTRCARYLERGTAKFRTVSAITYPKAAVFVDAAIVLKCFGVGVSYLIIIGDLMPRVVTGFTHDIGNHTYLLDRHFWITAFMLIVIPFSFLRKMDSLKFTNIIALVSIGYLWVLVVYHFAKGDTLAQKGHIKVIGTAGPIAFFSSVPVMVFGYTCHQNMFSIMNEMRDQAPKKTMSVILTSIGTAAVIYLSVAITGYLSFGDNITSNIVGMYVPNVPSTIGKGAIVVLVMFSYPLQVNPCRDSLNGVLKVVAKLRPDFLRRAHSDAARRAPLLGGAVRLPNNEKEYMSEARFATITTAIIILSYIVAMTVSSLERVLGFVGATGSTGISFILPGLLYYKISNPEGAPHQKLMKEDDEVEAERTGVEVGELSTSARSGWRTKILRRAALGLAMYGFVVMAVCLTTNFILIARER